ncbi:MAG TPA: flagellar protein FlgN [Burkholderiaceae bacterium]|nr:flagellar protein FlgN [Burkholderiaceae bacterium]
MDTETLTPAVTLKEEFRLTQVLIELLKQEQAHLIKADIEGLIAITEEKSRAATQMSELTNRRYQALEKAGFPAKEIGMRNWLDASAAAELTTYWKDLLKLAKSAKSLNNTNGLLINKHMTRNQKALNVLQGNLGSNVYGANGKATTTFRPRGLAVG